MRLILSRKGFDGEAGGVPSPIFEDGTMLSLPIPERGSPRTYADTTIHGRDLGEVVDQLSRGKIKPGYGLHLDPDLVPDTMPRAAGWRPAFGQANAAQGVLANEGVTVGDVFLFFGWFREVHETPSGLAYRRGAPDLHVIFGWLQVGTICRPQHDTVPAWLADHPHVTTRDRASNTLYVASEQLTLDGMSEKLPGAGTFRTYRDELRLTAPGCSRSVWSLPGCFAPGDGRATFSGHHRASRWSQANGRVQLQSVGRGQEFVLNVADCPEAAAWIRTVVGCGVARRL